jgi:hypothetical protein
VNIDPRFGIGGNNPPTFKETMAEKYGSVFAALEPLADMADEAPEKITGPDELARVSDIVRAARKLFNEVEEIRTREKQPFLDGGKEVDGFFGLKKDAIKRVVDAMQKRADAYQAEVDRLARMEAARKAAEAENEAKRQRGIAEAEAARGRIHAAHKHEERAQEAEHRAEQAVAATQVSAADLTRVRSEGGTTSATTEWLFEVEDYAAVDLNAVRAYIPRERVELAIRGFIKINKNQVPLAGVRIFQKTKAIIR